MQIFVHFAAMFIFETFHTFSVRQLFSENISRKFEIINLDKWRSNECRTANSKFDIFAMEKVADALQNFKLTFLLFHVELEKKNYFFSWFDSVCFETCRWTKFSEHSIDLPADCISINWFIIVCSWLPIWVWKIHSSTARHRFDRCPCQSSRLTWFSVAGFKLW